jgi:hypothetical protein
MRLSASGEDKVASELDDEDLVGRQFLFHCSCGAAIEMRQKKETCRNCGETVEVIRCVGTAKGQKYALRFRKRRKRSNLEPPGWPMGVVLAAVHPLGAPDKQKLRSSTDTTQPSRKETPDIEKGFRWLGLLMILLGALLLVPLTVGPEQLAIVMSQKPSDCDWLTLPLGDKDCHYEGSAVHDRNPNGDHISVKWQRVNDY